MRILKTVLVVLALSVLPLRAAAQQTSALDQVVDRIISQEQAEMNSLRPYSPLVETYIQNLKGDKDLGAIPAGDKYFLGRAVLAKGIDLEPLTEGDDDGGGVKKKTLRRTRKHVLALDGVSATRVPADDLYRHERV